ncbi:ABC transporter transmembrane domain-containing protein [Nocardioides dongxiaopingii]|uniref:ABC transporter transmembrane domain-containing protein n=1 Tax=Nocardioides dongxiaopingii TaxID=2576036 RepID=UPI0010C7699C|nr:ABC transporter ATP-binding protein [Nocardioides dongxiaopingii]
MPETGWGVVRRALRRNRRLLSPYVALLVSWQVCEALVPVVIGLTIDHGVATGDGSAFLAWAAGLCVLFAVLSYSYRFGARFGVRAIEGEVHELRSEVAAHALDARGLRTDRLAGETLSLATSDAEEVGYALRMAGYAAGSIVAVGIAAVVLLRTDLLLGLVILGGLPLCLAVTQVATPRIGRRSRVQQERAATSAGLAVDLVRGLRVLQGIGGQSAGAARYRVASGETRDAAVRVAGARAALAGLAQVLSGLFLAVVTLLAGRLALEGEISVGELIAIVGLTQFLAEPIAILADMSAQLASAVASGRRIVDFLASPHLPAGAADPAGARSHGATRGTTLSLSGVAHGSLRGLDLHSPPGELLGVAVADPADAQALVRLLGGDAHPDDVVGDVRLGGTPLGDLEVGVRRGTLVVVPHRVDLFEGTLRSNVDPWGRLDDDALDRVLLASAADEVLALRPGGLDEPVSASATTYSGGQRQRVAVARALAADAPVLVLHDPTTAVDPVTEQRVAAGIHDLRGPAAGDLTTWLVTCSPTLLARTDRVVLVRGGRVVLEGTHHDLLAHETYRETVLR